MLKVGDKVRIINACGGSLRRKLLNCETYITKVEDYFIKLNIDNSNDWWLSERLKKINEER